MLASFKSKLKQSDWKLVETQDAAWISHKEWIFECREVKAWILWNRLKQEVVGGFQDWNHRSVSIALECLAIYSSLMCDQHWLLLARIAIGVYNEWEHCVRPETEQQKSPITIQLEHRLELTQVTFNVMLCLGIKSGIRASSFFWFYNL